MWGASLFSVALVVAGVEDFLTSGTGDIVSTASGLTGSIAAVSIATVQAALSPFTPGSAPAGLQNPIAVGPELANVLSALSTAATISGIVCFPLAGASLVVRYRHATGIKQAQLKWFSRPRSGHSSGRRGSG